MKWKKFKKIEKWAAVNADLRMKLAAETKRCGELVQLKDEMRYRAEMAEAKLLLQNWEEVD